MYRPIIKFIADFGPLLLFFIIYFSNENDLKRAIPPFVIATLIALIVMAIQKAKFSIGDIVRHKHFEFRGVIYDVDFEFNNSEEWYQSIPKNVRPRKDQPFYHLLAENDEITYEAYVSEQNLLTDDSEEPIKHPLINEIFSK